ncbi:hypothetical protein KM043_017481 [Ampulex compressa]|nr:hypothetical protein KM043_017481 [Ampulex compressa]
MHSYSLNQDIGGRNGPCLPHCYTRVGLPDTWVPGALANTLVGPLRPRPGAHTSESVVTATPKRQRSAFAAFSPPRSSPRESAIHEARPRASLRKHAASASLENCGERTKRVAVPPGISSKIQDNEESKEILFRAPARLAVQQFGSFPYLG